MVIHLLFFPTGLKKKKKKEILFLCFFIIPGGSNGKESSGNEGDPGSIPGLGRSPGKGKGYPLQYSSLENSMREEHDRLQSGVTRSQT